MTTILLQMTAVMSCGIFWGMFRPAGLTAELTRKVLTSVVYYLFMPALILDVLWRAEIGLKSLYFSLLGATTIIFSMLWVGWAGKLLRFEHKQLGALVLAAVPNVTYLGLPVIEQVFGTQARSIVIQLDLFAAAPLVFTIGIMTARFYGESDSATHQPVWTFFNAPPFWTAAVAVLLNVSAVPVPFWFSGVLHNLSAAVVPLMLFSLGLALSWKIVKPSSMGYVAPVILGKLFLAPLLAFYLASYLPLDGRDKAAAVLDLAMPSMLLGVVFCDRYRLDSLLYAMTVTITTIISLFTLPFWHHLLINRFHL
jgi:predicted permease